MSTHRQLAGFTVNAQAPPRGRYWAGTRRVETDIQFLPPTAANLARLELTVPTGFRQVPPRIEHAVKKKKK